MAKRRLLIIGAGGHGRCVAEAATQSGLFEIVGFLDDAYDKSMVNVGCQLIGKSTDFENHREKCDSVFVAVGNNILREQLSLKLMKSGVISDNIIHPSAFVSPQVEMGRGCVIFAGSVIGPRTSLGNGVIVNCGAVIEHDASIHDFGHMGINTSMSSGSILGRGAWMKAGSILGHGAHLMDGAVLSMGAVHEAKQYL